MWVVHSFVCQLSPSGLTSHSEGIWLAVSCCSIFCYVYVVIRPTHCIVFKAHVENKGLFSCEVSTVPSARKYSVRFILTVPPWTIQCQLWLELTVSTDFSSIFENFYLSWSQSSGKSACTKDVSQWLRFLVCMAKESRPESSSVRTRFGLLASSNICSKGRYYRKQPPLQ